MLVFNLGHDAFFDNTLNCRSFCEWRLIIFEFFNINILLNFLRSFNQFRNICTFSFFLILVFGGSRINFRFWTIFKILRSRGFSWWTWLIFTDDSIYFFYFVHQSLKLNLNFWFIPFFVRGYLLFIGLVLSEKAHNCSL